MNILTAGGLYFVLVFLAGCILGPVRELWIAPHIGPTGAVLVEAPLMIIVMISAARRLVRGLRVPATRRTRASIGVVALGMLVVAELLGTRLLRGLSVSEYLAGLATIPGGISLGMFLLFAVMPLLVHRREGRTTAQKDRLWLRAERS